MFSVLFGITGPLKKHIPACAVRPVLDHQKAALSGIMVASLLLETFESKLLDVDKQMVCLACTTMTDVTFTQHFQIPTPQMACTQVPDVFSELTTREVLTTAWVEGAPMPDSACRMIHQRFCYPSLPLQHVHAFTGIMHLQVPTCCNAMTDKVLCREF